MRFQIPYICNHKIPVIQRSSVDFDEDIVVAELWYLDLLMKLEAARTRLAADCPLFRGKTHLSLLTLLN
jgi:hypothetical protein